jgi:uncharacterized protein YgbK (DUF1537 family)
MTDITTAQSEAIARTITREGLRQAVVTALAEVGEAANVDPIDVARRLTTAVCLYGSSDGWTDAQLRYAIRYLAEVGRELQARFEALAVDLVADSIEVWCHQYRAPAVYTAQDGCTACHGNGAHTALADAAPGCSHGADCTTHPGVAGPHNYDPQL